ncbi:MAG TPA: TylF/MycF family methyltransferase [Chloroflexota bacterium]|nr:TylF/MycF family methyltransferase [Chloroflexota bacterium]
MAKARTRCSKTDSELAELYLELLKKCLTDWFYVEQRGCEVRPIEMRRGRGWTTAVRNMALRTLRKHGLTLATRSPATMRSIGADWPVFGQTMIGVERLNNLQECVEKVLSDNVPGDLIETGVWRGGACIFMRALLKVYGVSDRTVWLADSFRGLPLPSAAFPQDRSDTHYSSPYLRAALDEVKANFQKYALLDEQVKFIPGWFSDSLPAAPIERLAVLRLDGDMYESTIVALENLYPKLSPGGYVIVDDYGAVAGCREAVDDFRAKRQIACPIARIDWTGIYWRRD